MIISDHRQPRRRALSPLKALGLLALFASLILLAGKVLSFQKGSREIPGGIIFCDAENRLGKFFLNGGMKFDNGDTQSARRSFAGKYSSRILPANQMQFGMGIRLDQLQPGGLYQATVWRFQHRNASKSYLAARSEGGKTPFYLTQSFSFKKGHSGWEQLRLLFFIPLKSPPHFTNVYVYSNGKDTVYFDDFRIELLQTFRETDFEIPELDIWLGKDAIQQLEAKRAEALQKGILETDPGDLIKGKIRWTGMDAPVAARFRLKGDWLDHLDPGKWSFRIELAGNQFWRGMQTFSIQHPATRHYLHEWMLHECWRREGVLTTSYDFVRVKLNGQSLGLYALEEHFEKYLPERQGRREGPIMKLDETGFWDGLRTQLDIAGSVAPHIHLPSSHPQHAAIEPFEAGRTAANPELATMAAQAASLIQQLRNGHKPPSELFDLGKMARFYAIADVLGASHSTAWHNLRFYYDPITGRLEPIGFDGYGTGPSDRKSFLLQGTGNVTDNPFPSLQDILFRDSLFVSQYLESLLHYSSPGYLASFLDSISPGRLPREIALLQEFPQYFFDDNEFVQSVLQKRAQLIPQAGFSFLAEKGEGNSWSLVNLHPYPLLLKGWARDAEETWTPLPHPVWCPGAPDRPLFFLSSLDTASLWPDMEQIRSKAGPLRGVSGWPPPTGIRLPPEAKYLVYQLPGTDTLFRQGLKPSLLHAGLTPRQELAGMPFHEKDPRWVVQGRQIRFLPGRHTFTDWLVIPEGYQVIAGPGVALDFTKGAGFLSFSPVHFEGGPDQPVRAGSSDGTGKGFTVLAGGQSSSLEYTIFENLKNLEWKGWSQTGAVLFLESEVRLSHCVFRHIRCEDALNLVRCKVRMSDCRFLDTSSDGFDCDFCTGEILRTVFSNCRNDGLDFSGSRVEVRDCTFRKCGEKGISIGEQSDVACFGNTVRETPTGIAVKDLSVAVIDEISLSGCATGFAVYQKKPEFGPARLIVREYSQENVENLHRVQWGSAMQMKDKMIRGTDPKGFE